MEPRVNKYTGARGKLICGPLRHPHGGLKADTRPPDDKIKIFRPHKIKTYLQLTSFDASAVEKQSLRVSTVNAQGVLLQRTISVVTALRAVLNVFIQAHSSLERKNAVLQR